MRTFNVIQVELWAVVDGLNIAWQKGSRKAVLQYFVNPRVCVKVILYEEAVGAT